MERLLVGDPTKLVTVLPSLEVGHGDRPQSPIVEHDQTKVSAPDSDPGVPSAVGVVLRPKAGRGTLTTSKNGLAALARLGGARFGVVVLTAENLASGYRLWLWSV